MSSTYAIGDVQGCFDDLLRLLEKLDFDPDVDRLWFTGDLVNKGPNSLELLRFVHGLGNAAISVLGNHDLHLLAVAAGAVKIRKKDTIAEILDAPDCEELLFWLRHQPILHHSKKLGFTMIHAGLPPQWDLEKARQCARELETVLQNTDYEDLFSHLSGDGPLHWREDLEGWERLHFITNCFTQLRWCDPGGRIDLPGKRRRVRNPASCQQAAANTLRTLGKARSCSVGQKNHERSSTGYRLCQWRALHGLSTRRPAIHQAKVQEQGRALEKSREELTKVMHT
jgi:bis(5'-nucleosyl)-tetraphosphatase (symmetrical)